ncbi:MAG: substrate-binding domain-containing protein, partial [Hydrogenoanaerobacterium sp.]
MKKILSIVLATVMVMSMSACGGAASSASSAAPSSSGASASAAPATEAKPLKIGISVPNMTNVFFLQIKAGIENALTGPNDEAIVMDANGDQNKQMNDVADMISQGCNVIGLSPINSDGVRATLEACKEAGVAVIAFNVGVKNPELVASTIVSDN